MDKKQFLGFFLSLFGALLGIVGGIGLFILTYEEYIEAELNNLGEEGCDIIIRDFLPIIGDLSIIGGILFALAAYGFWTNEDWSVSLAVVGNTLCLLAGFWPSIPALQMGLVPVWGIIFLPNLLIFLLMTHYVDDIPWITVLFALLTGVAYVMSFLNGIASTNRMETVGWPIFKGLQRVNWIAAIGWGIVTIGVLRRPRKDWIRILALGSATLGVVAGFPLATASSLSFDKFSMFFLAPILSTILLVIPLWPRLWDRMEKKVNVWDNENLIIFLLLFFDKEGN
ncbi:MAG: hypothetical protein ACW97P_13105 [Candidatus Hodarchaeales archaeon]|jgi:hypothetical protein